MPTTLVFAMSEPPPPDQRGQHVFVGGKGNVDCVLIVSDAT